MLVNLKKTFVKPSSEANFSTLLVRVRLTGTSSPARLYSPSGVLMNAHGIATLSSTGSTDVWVADGMTYDMDLIHATTGFEYSSVVAVDPQSTVQPAAPAAAPVAAGGTVTQVATSRALTDADDGATLELTAANLTLTVPAGLKANFGCTVIPNGSTVVTSATGVQLNGVAATSVTRSAAFNALFGLQARASVANSYVLTGS